MRDEWLAGLKPGDEVAVLYHEGRQIDIVRVVEVRDVRIVLSNGIQVSPDTGYEITSMYQRTHIAPLTDERVQRYQLLARLRVVRWADLPLATLEAVAAALEGGDNG